MIDDPKEVTGLKSAIQSAKSFWGERWLVKTNWSGVINFYIFINLFKII